MYLGRQGLCEVEPTPKGWYITYIDRSPEALARQAVRMLLCYLLSSPPPYSPVLV